MHPSIHRTHASGLSNESWLAGQSRSDQAYLTVSQLHLRTEIFLFAKICLDTDNDVLLDWSSLVRIFIANCLSATNTRWQDASDIFEPERYSKVAYDSLAFCASSAKPVARLVVGIEDSV